MELVVIPYNFVFNRIKSNNNIGGTDKLKTLAMKSIIIYHRTATNETNLFIRFFVWNSFHEKMLSYYILNIQG